MVPAFKEKATKFAGYLASGGVEPTWAKLVEVTSKETLLAHALRSAMPRQAAAAPREQPSAWQQAANAAANRERIAVAAAASKEAEDSWVPDEEWAKLTGPERKAKLAAWYKTKKPAAAAASLGK